MNEQPIKVKKRIDVLDVFRGFAILGIFVVNIVIMNSTFLNQDEFAKQWTSSIDQISGKILQLFFYTKFFPIFSLLFGLGISMQALKMLDKGKLSFSFFARRMFILFLFGVLHIVFLWSGDVLNLYALLGLITMVMIKKSNKLILTLSVVFLFFPFYDQLFEYVFNLLNFRPEIYLSDYTGETVNQIIKNGTYVEGIQLRLLEYLSNIPMLFGFLAPVAISMFLLGLYLGKNKIYDSLDTFIQRIKKPMLVIAVITNIYRVLFLFVLPDYAIYSTDTFRPVFIKLMVFSDIAMGLFYLWSIGWFWYNTRYKFIVSPLKYVGRMALTNYIMQSFIGLILFSSIGFGLYETLSPSQTLLTAIVVFVFQVLLSKIWLTYYQFGPLEWIWRCLTYKELLPIKKATISGKV
ncbi:uncharacterized protein IWQ47_001656 [Aquimarina sp. EL_43]|uniref:DUF418 domain-containing protein n=2 Tax=Aquimarina TaxID=290174 RepID=UPI0018CBE02C|nr:MULTISPECIES: DUF418 domain-containing protein [unclassified Aquimarina]MBG6130261.1 uncharacterized protein [Aquimarina sp. EL_35]MBG6149041.1 uncharacterized protein [Aquimarina sp. EL_32]MBG6168585.1 uncharacterized protein [Aquimarina sp. EL_43]